MPTTLGSKDLEIREVEFVTKIQFLLINSHLKFSKNIKKNLFFLDKGEIIFKALNCPPKSEGEG